MVVGGWLSAVSNSLIGIRYPLFAVYRQNEKKKILTS